LEARAVPPLPIPARRAGAHRRDRGIRAAYVAPGIYDSWRQRGGEWLKGYPLDAPQYSSMAGADLTRCPPGTTTVQAFARLNEPVSNRRLACMASDKTVSWTR
jgi:hypothetical protein